MHPMFIAALFAIAETRTCTSIEEWTKNGGTYTQGNIIWP